MTFYSFRGTVTFFLILALIVIAALSGDMEGAGELVLLLIGGVVLYYVGRMIIRGITGWDPDTSTTRAERESLDRERNTSSPSKSDSTIND